MEGQSLLLALWDFVLTRNDGSGIRLHPVWDQNKVESYRFDGHPEPVEPPRKGPGTTNGPGTYKMYKELAIDKMLRFDPYKRP